MNAVSIFAPAMIPGGRCTCIPINHVDGLSVPLLKATLTKLTPSLQVENLFLFQLPAKFLTLANFRRPVGKLSSTTNPDQTKHKRVWSEALIGLAYTTCSLRAVFVQINGHPSEISAVFPTHGLPALIVKQSNPETVTNPVAIKLPAALPVRLSPGGCLFMSFDGADFASRLYTMTSNLSLRYDALPPKPASYSINGLDAEPVVTSNAARDPVLNTNTVIPVSQERPIHSKCPPDVCGAAVTSCHWSTLGTVSVYHDRNCDIAFPRHPEHKFMWSDHSDQWPRPQSFQYAKACKKEDSGYFS